ncbi:hypothetical protein [Pectobacterium phage PcCB7V]|nr:hypothetical protein [Pectobacterium phage PcCB7V]
MTTANRLIAVLNDAKANRLAVSIKEQDNGQIFASVTDGCYTESFHADSLEYLTHRLEMIVDDWRLM